MNFISEDKKIITLPVPLGETIYLFTVSCNNACYFQKEKFNEIFPPDSTQIGRCVDCICKIKSWEIYRKTLSLSNLEWVLKEWNVKIFATEQESEEARNKLISKNKKQLLELGLKI